MMATWNEIVSIIDIFTSIICFTQSLPLIQVRLLSKNISYDMYWISVPLLELHLLCKYDVLLMYY